jgi:hypothetical protein
VLVRSWTRLSPLAGALAALQAMGSRTNGKVCLIAVATMAGHATAMVCLVLLATPSKVGYWYWGDAAACAAVVTPAALVGCSTWGLGGLHWATLLTVDCCLAVATHPGDQAWVPPLGPRLMLSMLSCSLFSVCCVLWIG